MFGQTETHPFHGRPGGRRGARARARLTLRASCASGLLACAAVLALPGAAARAAAAPDYSTTEVVVQYAPTSSPVARAARTSGAGGADPTDQSATLVRLHAGETVVSALRRLRRR